MKKVVYIPALILLYLLFTAKSCDNQEQADTARVEKRITATKDSIANVFKSDTLNDPALRAFEATARLKLYDLCDYLKILSDSIVKEGFKTKVEQMIRALCISGDEKFRFRTSNFNKLIVPGGVDFDSVKVQKPLQKTNDSLYSGQMRFLIHFPHSGKSGKNVFHDEKKYIDIYLIKREKVFGQNSLKVWTILFGDINKTQL